MNKVSRIEFNEKYFTDEDSMWESIKSSIMVLLRTGYVIRCLKDSNTGTILLDFEKVDMGKRPFPFFLTPEESAGAVIAKAEMEKQKAQETLKSPLFNDEVLDADSIDEELEGYDIESFDEVEQVNKAIKESISKKKKSA